MVCYFKTYRANEKINDKNLNLTSMKKYLSILLAAFALASCPNRTEERRVGHECVSTARYV